MFQNVSLCLSHTLTDTQPDVINGEVVAGDADAQLWFVPEEQWPVEPILLHVSQVVLCRGAGVVVSLRTCLILYHLTT